MKVVQLIPGTGSVLLPELHARRRVDARLARTRR